MNILPVKKVHLLKSSLVTVKFMILGKELMKMVNLNIGIIENPIGSNLESDKYGK